VIARADAIPAPVAASAVAAGAQPGKAAPPPAPQTAAPTPAGNKPTLLRGRVWIVGHDNIDTDMIYHNRHLAVTDPAQMGQHAFGNLPGLEAFAKEARPGDIVVTGKNFGCGSSRQQAVDCFQTLGVTAIVATSFGAIYERNAINAGLPLVAADLLSAGLKDGDEITIDLATSRIAWAGGAVQAEPFSTVQMAIYQRGGLLGG
jgi:3-isopropylmalate dehydratase small subunit